MNSSPRRFNASLWGLALVGLVLRLHRLNYFSYWLDEIMQAFFVHGSWSAFWRSLRFDAVHPPLDYLVCRIVEFANPSDPVRKLPAVLWGTLTIPALGVLVSRRAGSLAGMSAAAILALAPFHVRYSQELRPYSLGTFLVVIALISLDWYLAQPSARRLAVLFLAFLAAAYTLYLGGVISALAAAAMLVEDSFDTEPARRRAARRALLWSPAFLAALAVAYLPWLPVIRVAATRAPEGAPPAVTVARYRSLFAFFSTASGEGQALSRWDAPLLLTTILGGIACFRRKGSRYFLAWMICGAGMIEALEQIHPHIPAARHFVPVGLAIMALGGIGISTAARWTKFPRLVTSLLVITIIAADVRGLRDYFDHGRPDWRPLAAYLRSQASGGRILTENQWIQLCLGFYLDGVASFHDHGPKPWDIITLQGDPKPIAWLWNRGHRTWLITCQCGAQSDPVKEFAGPYRIYLFPTADGAELSLLP